MTAVIALCAQAVLGVVVGVIAATTRRTFLWIDAVALCLLGWVAGVAWVSTPWSWAGMVAGVCAAVTTASVVSGWRRS